MDGGDGDDWDVLPPRAARDDDKEEDDSQIAELARQIRRDLLARRLAEGDAEVAQAAAAASADAAGTLAANNPERWALRTDSAQKSLAALQRSLDEADARAEAQRRQLNEYVEELRSRTFAAGEAGPAKTASSSSTALAGAASAEDSPLAAAPAGPGAADAAGAGGVADEPTEPQERLVSMPADFDDVVDLNAHHVVQQRRLQDRGGQGAARGAAAGAGGGGAESAGGGFQLPPFLDKHLFESQAVEHEEEVQKGGDDSQLAKVMDSELAKGMRQIAKLDGLLARREADCEARLKIAQVEFERARSRLQRERDEIEQQKIEKLRQLKERGLISGGAPSKAPSARASQASTHTTQGSTTQLAVRTVEAEAPALMWSAWTCSVPGANPPAGALAVAPPSGGDDVAAAEAEQLDEPEAAAEEVDTTTFNLTSVTGSLPQHEARRRAAASSSPAAASSGAQESPAKGRGAGGSVQLARVDEEESEPPGEDGPAELADPAAEHPYDPDEDTWDKLLRIDDQLRKLVPERDWEAKSIVSLPPRGSESALSERDGPPRSVWSRSCAGGPAPSLVDAALPGDPALRQQMELHNAEAALASIDSRLQELRALEDVDPMAQPPEADQLRRLLMQAHQESAPPDARDKVLALTGGALALPAGDDVLAAPPRALLPESATLPSARRILSRLSGGGSGEFDDACREAQYTLEQLESGAAVLEEAAAAEQAAPPPGEESERPQSASALQPLAGRLEQMAEEARRLVERPAPGQELLRKLREDLAREATEEATRAQERLKGLPTLSSAAAGGAADEDDEDDLLSLLSGEVGDPDAPDVEVADDDEAPTEAATFAGAVAPVAAAAPAGGPSDALRAALDIELPAGDGLWDDAELERVVRAMDSHYGDVPGPVAAAPGPEAAGAESEEEYASI